MSLDKILFFISLIPLFFMLFKQESLMKTKVFLKYLLVSIITLSLGIIYYKLIATEKKPLVYFGSQIPLLFLLLHVIFGTIFFKIFNRYPEVNEVSDKLIDSVYSIILILAIILLPILINEYIVKQL